MLFKGINLEPGDIIEFTTIENPNETQTAAIAQFYIDLIIVFSDSPCLAVHTDIYGVDWFNHNGYLREDDLISIKRTCAARRAVTRNSDGYNYRRNQKIGLYRNKKLHICKVVAAFEGIIYFEPSCFDEIVAYASNFTKLH
jgi:signal peptidase I